MVHNNLECLRKMEIILNSINRVDGEQHTNKPSIFSSNSEAFASKLLENMEDMFHCCPYMRGDVLSNFKN